MPEINILYLEMRHLTRCDEQNYCINAMLAVKLRRSLYFFNKAFSVECGNERLKFLFEFNSI